MRLVQGFVVVLAVLLTGCGGSSTAGPAPGPEPTPTPSPTGSPPAQTATLEIVGFGHFGDTPAQGSFPVEAVVRHRTPERVEFRVDGRLINADTRFPYMLGGRAEWDSRTAANGRHTLAARAIFADGTRLERALEFRVENALRQRAYLVGGRYHVFVDDGEHELAFSLPDSCEGLPYEGRLHCVGFGLEDRLWSHNGVQFERYTRPGHTCHGPDVDTNGDGEADTYIARRSHRTLSVLLETSRLDTRLTTTISWQGTSATCEMGGGTLAFDAPIERRGGAREPPDTFVTRRAGDVLRAWVRGLGTGADESPVPFEAVFDIVDRGPGRYGDAAGALAPVTEVQSIVGGELLLNDPSCPGPPTSVVAEGEITRADTRLEGRGWRLRGLWNGDEDAERCRAAEVQFSFAAPIE